MSSQITNLTINTSQVSQTNNPIINVSLTNPITPIGNDVSGNLLYNKKSK